MKMILSHDDLAGEPRQVLVLDGVPASKNETSLALVDILELFIFLQIPVPNEIEHPRLEVHPVLQQEPLHIHVRSSFSVVCPSRRSWGLLTLVSVALQ